MMAMSDISKTTTDIYMSKASGFSAIGIRLCWPPDLTREYRDTHDPEIPEEIFELARRLKEMERWRGQSES